MGDNQHGEIIKEKDVIKLIEYFSRVNYRAREANNISEGFERKCQALFAKDYKFTLIHNNNGELCGHYPTKIIVQEYTLENGDDGAELVEPMYDIAKLRELMFRSRLARCRGRFVVPVILYEGKHICRSATLSGGPEIYGRSGLNFILSGGNAAEDYDRDDDIGANSTEWPLCDRVRNSDIKLLQLLGVSHICDLMLENKKVKFGMNVSSSEKIDKAQRYSQFCLLSIPYPGCEFFRDYRNNGFSAEGIQFDWSQDFVDADLSIPDSMALKTGIDWHLYRAWDLTNITQNYLKLLLHIIKKGDQGLLVHCISGWDRTPLFISLLRLSLWADGKVNASLSPLEILYLTISYDWLLFGHQLSDRLVKGEDIFFFCFNFLKHLTSSEFSVNRTLRTEEIEDPEFPDGEILHDLHENHFRKDSLSSISSNVSITSIGSTSSPILTRVHGSDTCVHNIASVKCNGSNTSVGYINRPRISSNKSDPGRTQENYSTSPPVAVPSSSHQSLSNEARSNPSIFGSWQLVSETGSLKSNSCNAQFSTHSDGSSCSSYGSCQSIPQSLSRKQKLEEVSHLFKKFYSKVIGPVEPGEGAGIGSMLDSITSKIGFNRF